MIKAPPSKRIHVESALNKIPQCISLYSISGAFDMSAIVMANSVPELDKVIDEIGVLSGVEETCHPLSWQQSLISINDKANDDKKKCWR